MIEDEAMVLEDDLDAVPGPVKVDNI